MYLWLNTVNTQYLADREEVDLEQSFLTGVNITGMQLAGISMTGENMIMIWAMAGLVILAVLLLAGWYGVQNHTVRVYNWDGRRYCYLGRTGVYRKDDGYFVHIKERMADLSYTTLYQICPARRFVRKNRYRNLMLIAGEERCMLHVDGCMRQSIYYRNRVIW